LEVGAGAVGGFGELLLRHRLVVGLSQRELALRSGLSERAVRDLERGVVATPRRGSVRALAAGLGLTGDDLAGLFAAAVRTSRRCSPVVVAWSAADLVGRRAELRALVDLVIGSRYRIVTVTGPAGIGKSRLAASLVAVLGGRPELAVYTVDFSGLGEPALVGEVIAEAVGSPGSSRLAPVDRVAVELRQRPAVLVLDCFERLVDAAAVLAAMVRRCPGLRVLVTSRRPLELAGERRLPLGPLPLADAVELFLRRAASVVPGFAASPDNEPAIRSICSAADGLPLAVELAAARMRVLSAAELAARLDRPLQLLTGGPRDAPDRHRSLRAAIESSLELIGDQASGLLAWLAPFAGGVRLADLEQVVERLCGESGWVVGALGELIDAGLVRGGGDRTHSRYLLPDAVRQLAGELLSARGDAFAVREAIALGYLHLLQVAAASADGRGYAGLDPELDNLRAAVDWACAHRPAVFDAATVQALYRFHELRGRYGEGRATLVRLACADAAGAAWALVGAANFARLRKDTDDAEALVARAEALRSSDDHGTRAAAELLRGNLAADRGALPAAATHTAAAAQAARIAGDEQALGRALNNLGGIALVRGELSDAEQYYRESLAVRRRAGAPDRDLGLTLMNLADLARTGRRWAAAIRHAREAADLLDRAGDPRLRAMALSTLALAALRGGATGDRQSAAAAIDQATGLLAAFGDDTSMRAIVQARHSIVLHACGHPQQAFPTLVEAAEAMTGTLSQFEIAPIIEAHAALLARRDPAAAARLLGLALAVRDNQEHPQPPLLQPANHTAKVCRTQLGSAGYARAHQLGAAQYRHGLPDALAELLA
jgi:predicted ATPase/transcriptional regulator with XRE-family HTH domain